MELPPPIVDNSAPFLIRHQLRTSCAKIELRDYQDVFNTKVIAQEDRSTLGRIISSRPISARYIGTNAPSEYRELGSLIFRPRGIPWEAHTNGGAMESLVCIFDEEIERIGGDIDWRSSALEECLHLRSKDVGRTLNSIGRELRAPGFASEIMVEGLSLTLAAQLVRHFDKPGKAKVGRKPVLLSSAELLRIEEYLNSISGTIPRISDIAAICNLNVKQTMRAFKLTTGGNLGAYIAKSQLDRARSMLSGTNMCLKEISFLVGFSSHSNFSAAFHNATGESPTEFRRRFS